MYSWDEGLAAQIGREFGVLVEGQQGEAVLPVNGFARNDVRLCRQPGCGGLFLVALGLLRCFANYYY